MKKKRTIEKLHKEVYTEGQKNEQLREKFSVMIAQKYKQELHQKLGIEQKLAPKTSGATRSRSDSLTVPAALPQFRPTSPGIRDGLSISSNAVGGNLNVSSSTVNAPPKIGKEATVPSNTSGGVLPQVDGKGYVIPQAASSQISQIQDKVSVAQAPASPPFTVSKLETPPVERDYFELESIALIQNTLAQRLAQQKAGETNTLVTKAQVLILGKLLRGVHISEEELTMAGISLVGNSLFPGEDSEEAARMKQRHSAKKDDYVELKVAGQKLLQTQKL